MSALFPSHAKVVVDADGIHVTTDDTDAPDPRAAFKQRLADAWRGPDRATTQTLDHIKRKQQLSEAWKGEQQRDSDGPYGVTPRKSAPDAETAYSQRSERMANAWRPPPVVEQPALELQKRKYRPGLASYDPGDSTPMKHGGHDANVRTKHSAADGDQDGRTHHQRAGSEHAAPDFHFDDDGAQTARDQANAAYVDRIRNAWKVKA